MYARTVLCNFAGLRLPDFFPQFGAPSRPLQHAGLVYDLIPEWPLCGLPRHSSILIQMGHSAPRLLSLAAIGLRPSTLAIFSNSPGPSA
jgi:hypothetical protein